MTDRAIEEWVERFSIQTKPTQVKTCMIGCWAELSMLEPDPGNQDVRCGVRHPAMYQTRQFSNSAIRVDCLSRTMPARESHKVHACTRGSLTERHSARSYPHQTMEGQGDIPTFDLDPQLKSG